MARNAFARCSKSLAVCIRCWLASTHSPIWLCGSCRDLSHNLTSGQPACCVRLKRSTHSRFARSEEHTSELQSHRDLHSFPTRRSSDLSHLAVRILPRFVAQLDVWAAGVLRQAEAIDPQSIR